MKNTRSRLRFNFGYLLEAGRGTKRTVELDYPDIRIAEDVTLAPLQGRFVATRTTQGIYLEGQLLTNVETECARCLATVLIPIELELNDLFYFPPPAPPGEFAVGEDAFIDLSPLVRELALLAVPSQAYCRAVCQGLCPNCGQDLNEGPCDCDLDEIDPRLEILRGLLEDES